MRFLRLNYLQALSALICIAMSACVTAPPGTGLDGTGLTLQEITQLLPDKVVDKDGWASDIKAAIEALDINATEEHVCAAAAVIDQESNFQINPKVKDLPQIVRQAILNKFYRLGILAEPAMVLLLAGKIPGKDETFSRRIQYLKTEKDLDLFFREIALAYRDKFPGPYVITSAISKLLGPGYLEQLNPVTTLGSMQVKIDFARDLPGSSDRSDSELRDWLYTREGGVKAGIARLLGYNASYDDVIFRFADYNSGIYSSRNAAFQEALSGLTGQPLSLDGDLLSYKDGEVADVESKSLHAMRTFAKEHSIWEWIVNRDFQKEKSEDFEQTVSWSEVYSATTAKSGSKLHYARIPIVTLDSPKLSTPRTTDWYAKNVKHRYNNCRARKLNVGNS